MKIVNLFILVNFTFGNAERRCASLRVLPVFNGDCFEELFGLLLAADFHRCKSPDYLIFFFFEEESKRPFLGSTMIWDGAIRTMSL